MVCVAVTWDFHRPAALRDLGAAWVVDSPVELVDLLVRLTGTGA